MTSKEKLEQELKKLYDNSMKSKENYENMVKVFSGENMRNVIEDFLSKKTLKKPDLPLAETILKCANSIYNYSGESTGMSDSEYDKLLEMYQYKSGTSLITVNVPDEDVIYHKYPDLRGTLDKIYKLTDEDVVSNESQKHKTLEDWIKTTERRYKEKTYGRQITMSELDVYCFPKLDGVSCVFECNKDGTLDRALTRGDVNNNTAQDVTHIFKSIFKSPLGEQKVEYGFKTEIMMKDDALIEYNEKYHTNYKSTRSIVSSIMNSKEVDDRIKYLTIVPLRYQLKGSETQELPPTAFDYPYIECKMRETAKMREFAFNLPEVMFGLRCDGMVIYIKDPEVRKTLGREDHKQKSEVAFKYTQETIYTKVKDIVWETGLFGRMTPVVVVKPVTMKGNEVKRASLSNYARMKALNLAKGDIVKLMYDIIPYADFDINDPYCKKSGNPPIEPPEVCPECGKKLELDDNKIYISCKNKKCPARIKGKILNWCKRVKIENVSEATINKLYQEKILTSIPDLYKLEKYAAEIVDLPGFGPDKLHLILQSIYDTREMSEDMFLGALGIEGIGPKTFQKLLEKFSFDDIIDISLNGYYTEFVEVPGIKETTANKIIEGVSQNVPLIEEMQELIHIKPYVFGSTFNVVFTKVRDKNLEQEIEDLGGKVQDTVTAKTNYVVVPELGTTSNKTLKAEKYGIPVIRISDLPEILEKYK